MSRFDKAVKGVLRQYLQSRSLAPADAGLLREFMRETGFLQKQNVLDDHVERYLRAYGQLHDSICHRNDLEPGIRALVDSRGFLMNTLWHVYFPLMNYLENDPTLAETGRCKVLGVLGGQGTGKTLMSKMMKLALESASHKVLYFSSDDFYLPFADRQQLAKTHPFVQYRGPPGTHDVDLLYQVMHDVKRGLPTRVPVFNKSLHAGMGDREGFLEVPDTASYDYCIFEGWFNGLRAVDDALLAHKPEISRFSNHHLKRFGDWSMLDRLFVLRAADFSYSYKWRLQAEQRMGGGMSEEEIRKFVSYFMDALDPELYYGHLYRAADHNIGLEFVLDLDHRVVEFKKYR